MTSVGISIFICLTDSAGHAFTCRTTADIAGGLTFRK